jgi:Na+-transporting NADH:ubiquinone oxidoreductase subunit B
MFSVHPLWHLVMGSFAFGIVYMATDPVSGPGMNLSRWIYGFAIGALTVMIRVFNPAYPEGVMLSILFMNIFAPLIDHFVIKVRVGRRVPNV